MPNLFVIAGPNGAGKTTASYTIFPELLNCKIFVNADEIARGLSPFEPEKVAIEAGKIMLKRLDDLLEKKQDFGFETTLSGITHLNFIKKAVEKGYQITLIYLWINSPVLALKRVNERVLKGGHNIPEETVFRRYYAGIKNLFKLYIPICDYWLLADNSEQPFKIIAKKLHNRNIKIYKKLLFNKLKTL